MGTILNKCLQVCLFSLLISSLSIAEVIVDSFDKSHNYLTDGVSGTIWDGYIGQGTGETITELNASQIASGQLYMSSQNSRWEPGWVDLGPFLYRIVEGDFSATVHVTDASATNWNSAGLMARAATDSAGGAGEDFESIEYFQAISQNMARTIDNGSESEFGRTGDFMSYLRLRRVGNDFHHEYSADGTNWITISGSPINRADLDGLPMQVGIAHATYSSNLCYFQFDDFSIEVEGEVNEAQLVSPDDGADGTAADILLEWTAGAGSAETGGHDLYIGRSYAEVEAATRGNHPNIDYYNLDVPSYQSGGLIPGATYYWRVDEVNMPEIWQGEVWSFTVQGPQAAGAMPADGGSGIELLTVLSWQSGLGADRHDVFLADNFDDIAEVEKYRGDIDFDGIVDIVDLAGLVSKWLGDGCSGSGCGDIELDAKINLNDFSILAGDWQKESGKAYKVSQAAEENTYDPGLLSPATTYYWRVDEYDYDEVGLSNGDIWSFTTAADGPLEFGNDEFELTFDLSSGGFSKIQRRGDSFATNFVSEPGWRLGDLELTYRIDRGSWQNAATAVSDDNRKVALSKDGEATLIDVTYPRASGATDGVSDFDIEQQWRLDGGHLSLEVIITNTTGGILELGDLAFMLPFNTNYDGLDTDIIQTRRVIRHGYFSGHGSHCYWTRVNGMPDYLVMSTPGSDTRFEYWDNIAASDARFRAYVYSGVAGPARAGNWRQEHTTKVLAAGESIELGLSFSWAESLAEVRDRLYEDGDIDIECVPGMTIPQDLHAVVKLRTKQAIDSLVAEYPAETMIEYLGVSGADAHLYKISFSRLGENIVKVNHNGSEQTVLEFYCCEPLETLYKKRAAHMAGYEQVVNPSVWYDGLFGEWDLRSGSLRTPSDSDGMDLPWWIYVICCDDPGGAHAPFLAGKNVRFPVQSEINALEYHIDNYIWGGMQYTDTESYPYGIIGVPTWEYNRANDPTHYWRVFDYPHVVMLYYHMYEIAKYYPDMVNYLDADGYLNRAYQTALKYFNVADGWGYVVGTYNEVVYVNLIESLREEGWTSQADALQAEWDKKVKYFIFEKEYPYGSEYAMDSTAFESTHALAKWAIENGLEPDAEHPEIDQSRIEDFMHNQMKANLAVRGCVEPAFYTYGSDYRVWGQTRYTLSYMSQMGGWAVLDYAFNWADNPIDYIRLGYGSYLSSWALMNSDPTGSNQYWYPSSANDGAIGWAFKPEKNGPIWLQGRNQDRGIWYYNGEIDLGLCGALRMAKSVVADDPVFGLFGFGCDVELVGTSYGVIMKDGLREWLVMHNLGMELQLNRDSFAGGMPVEISEAKDVVNFTLENEWPGSHITVLKISGLAIGSYSVKVNGKERQILTFPDPAIAASIDLNIGTESTSAVSITKL